MATATTDTTTRTYRFGHQVITTQGFRTCSRCKGKGFGPWAPEMGRCHGCAGTGNGLVGKAQRELTKAHMASVLRRQEASVLLQADSPRAARQAMWLAFDPDNSDANVMPTATELAPGWYACSVILDPQNWEA